MVLPAIRLVIVTFNRPKEIRVVINSLQKNLRYDGKILWRLADDGSPRGYVADILKEYEHLSMDAIITDRGGWGRNVNNALRATTEPYIFLIEDDYVSLFPIDLNSGVTVMEEEPEIGVVRYDGLSGHTLNLKLREVKGIPVLYIDQKSPHLNVYSNRPHLKSKKFHDVMGYYVEGESLGATEDNFAHRVKDYKKGDMQIVALYDGIRQAFDHIGKSWQGGEYDHPSL